MNGKQLRRQEKEQRRSKRSVQRQEKWFRNTPESEILHRATQLASVADSVVSSKVVISMLWEVSTKIPDCHLTLARFTDAALSATSMLVVEIGQDMNLVWRPVTVQEFYQNLPS